MRGYDMCVVVLVIKGVIDQRYTRDESSVGEAKFVGSAAIFLQGLLPSGFSRANILVPLSFTESSDRA